MFRVFMALENKQRGILVKLAGEVRTVGDEKTGAGRVVTTFDNNPQVPVSNITVNLDSGPRAPLATPPSCGEQDRGRRRVVFVGWADRGAHAAASRSTAPRGWVGLRRVCGRVRWLCRWGVLAVGGRDQSCGWAAVHLGVSLETPWDRREVQGVPLCSDAQANAGSVRWSRGLGLRRLVRARGRIRSTSGARWR